jgi:hypothetical protein
LPGELLCEFEKPSAMQRVFDLLKSLNEAQAFVDFAIGFKEFCGRLVSHVFLAGVLGGNADGAT